MYKYKKTSLDEKLFERTLKEFYKTYLEVEKEKEKNAGVKGWQDRAVQTALEFYIEHHSTPNKEKHSPLFEFLNEWMEILFFFNYFVYQYNRKVINTFL